MDDNIHAIVDQMTSGRIKDSGDEDLNKGRVQMQRNANGSVSSATEDRALKRAINSVTMCKFLDQGGTCRWGANCRFLHPGDNQGMFLKREAHHFLHPRPALASSTMVNSPTSVTRYPVKRLHPEHLTQSTKPSQELYPVKRLRKVEPDCTINSVLELRNRPTEQSNRYCDEEASRRSLNHDAGMPNRYYGEGVENRRSYLESPRRDDQRLHNVEPDFPINTVLELHDRPIEQSNRYRDDKASQRSFNHEAGMPSRYNDGVENRRLCLESPRRDDQRLRNVEPDLPINTVLELHNRPIEQSNRYRDDKASQRSFNHDAGMPSRYNDGVENRRLCLESPRRDDQRLRNVEPDLTINSVLELHDKPIDRGLSHIASEKQSVGEKGLDADNPTAINRMIEKSSVEKPRTEIPRTENRRDNRSKVDCKFYTKTGLCKWGDKCAHNHPQGENSTVLILQNFFQHPDLRRGLFDNETRYDTKNLLDAYSSFYRFVHEKFASIGKIVMFKCCCNAKDYLQGSVFVQYATHSEAAEAQKTLDGEMYGARRMNIKLVPLTSWYVASCGKSQRKISHDEDTCSFLHFFPNPNGAYEVKNESRNESRMPRSRSRSNSVVLIDDEDDDDDHGSRKRKYRKRNHQSRGESRRSRDNSYGGDGSGDEERDSEYIVHVTRLPKKQTESDIRMFFDAFDGIKDVNIPESHSTSQKLFSAFIVFENRRMAEKIMKKRHLMDGQELRLAGVDPLGKGKSKSRRSPSRRRSSSGRRSLSGTRRSSIRRRSPSSRLRSSSSSPSRRRSPSNGRRSPSGTRRSSSRRRSRSSRLRSPSSSRVSAQITTPLRTKTGVSERLQSHIARHFDEN